MTWAYYNEFDSKKAAWLRELIKRGVVAPGEVDERSILDVRPDDLRGFAQCHFFAGIGVWSYAMRLAGWPDERPAWTGSCPCQPFSVAGEGKALEDERHLFPAWFGLIEARRPITVFGEQVSDGDGLTWLDVVHTSMDAAGYTLGVVDTCAAGFGAPMRSQRLYFVAEAAEAGLERRSTRPFHSPGEIKRLERLRHVGELGATAESRSLRCAYGRVHSAAPGQRPRDGEPGRSGDACVMGTPDETGPQGQQFGRDGGSELAARAAGMACGVAAPAKSGRRKERADGRRLRTGDRAERRAAGLDTGGAPGPVNGFWRDAEWIWCRDEKWRAVKPGSFPLAYGAPARVGRLRGYGDAINAYQAAAFVRAYIETRG